MIDIIIIFVILIIVSLVFKRFDNTVIFFGIIDVILRILNFIGNNTIKEINNVIDKYLPASIEAVIRANSQGLLETILVWGYVILMAMFIYYVTRMLFHRL